MCFAWFGRQVTMPPARSRFESSALHSTLQVRPRLFTLILGVWTQCIVLLDIEDLGNSHGVMTLKRQDVPLSLHRYFACTIIFLQQVSSN